MVVEYGRCDADMAEEGQERGNEGTRIWLNVVLSSLEIVFQSRPATDEVLYSQRQWSDVGRQCKHKLSFDVLCPFLVSMVSKPQIRTYTLCRRRQGLRC